MVTPDQVLGLLACQPTMGCTPRSAPHGIQITAVPGMDWHSLSRTHNGKYLGQAVVDSRFRTLSTVRSRR